MHIDDEVITLRIDQNRAIGSIAIVDETGTALGGAEVDAFWSIFGFPEPTRTAETRASGTAKFPLVGPPSGAPLRIRVLDVRHSDVAYAPADNREICSQAIWPG